MEVREKDEIITIPPMKIPIKEWKEISGKKQFFRGNIYILTSNKTFDSALFWTYVFRDNKLATIVGDVPGGAPTSFGDGTYEFETPHSKLKFELSHKKFYRDYGEENEKYDQNKLIPDFEVSADRALEKVYNNIKLN